MVTFEGFVPALQSATQATVGVPPPLCTSTTELWIDAPEQILRVSRCSLPCEPYQYDSGGTIGLAECDDVAAAWTRDDRHAVLHIRARYEDVFWASCDSENRQRQGQCCRVR